MAHIYKPFKKLSRREEDTMSFMDSPDPLYKLMSAAEVEAFDKLPIQEREYQKYLVRMRLFPPVNVKILTREEFYETFKKVEKKG